ncbi:MAG TPA: hypothetical protein VF704_00155 [Allosphingosinicella sp.]
MQHKLQTRVSGTSMRLLPILLLLCVGPIPAAAEPLGYRIAATLVPQHGMMAVDVTVTLPPVQAGERVTFVVGSGFRFTRIESAEGPHSAPRATERPWPGLQEVAFTFPRAAARPTVRMAYFGRPNPAGDLPINQVSPRLVELSLDGMWLPILPSLEGNFTVEAMLSGLPADAVVAAQGEVRRPGERVLVRRAQPGFDFAFAASPSFRVVEQDGFTLFAADPDAALPRLYREHVASARTFLTGWFGALPGPALRLAIVERPRRSGYARPGYIVVVDQGAPPQPVGAGKFIAHEMSHLWFANANATTVDRWLDESTAEYVSLRYVEQAFGAAEREAMLAAKREEAARAPPLLAEQSGAGLYAKGPLLLFALEQRIGRARIDALLSEVARRRIGRTADFLAALMAIAGAADAAWFEGQLRSR